MNYFTNDNELLASSNEPVVSFTDSKNYLQVMMIQLMNPLLSFTLSKELLASDDDTSNEPVLTPNAVND